MGSEFSVAARELSESFEDLGLHQLCSRAFSEPGDQLQMDRHSLEAKLRSWADDPEHDMWIRVGVHRISSGRHA
jgi:hypothetical protein